MDVLINTISASEAQFTYINPYHGLAENYVPFVTSTGASKFNVSDIGARHDALAQRHVLLRRPE